MSIQTKTIKKAILSVYYKDGLDKLVTLLHAQGVELYSTGGTYQFITDLGLPCLQIDSLTGFPEILGVESRRCTQLYSGAFWLAQNS